MMELSETLFFKKLLQQPVVEQIWLFGSRARGDHQERADIDMAILCPKATVMDWQTILDIIDEADTLLKIDCIRLDTLSESSDLRKSILTQGKKLYDRKC